MAYIAMACIVMAYIAMACIVMAYAVGTYIVMAYIVIAYGRKNLSAHRQGSARLSAVTALAE